MFNLSTIKAFVRKNAFSVAQVYGDNLDNPKVRRMAIRFYLGAIRASEINLADMIKAV